MLGQLLCSPLVAPVMTPRSRSRSEVLVRSMRSLLPTAGSSSAGLSARHRHAGRAATGRRRELGLARGQVAARADDLAMRATGRGGARIGIASRRLRFFAGPSCAPDTVNVCVRGHPRKSHGTAVCAKLHVVGIIRDRTLGSNNQVDRGKSPLARARRSSPQPAAARRSTRHDFRQRGGRTY